MSINQYPEHLNPFAEESRHNNGFRIGNSFRDFTKSLRKSFRIKKKDKLHDQVEIRRRAPDIPRPFPMSYPSSREQLLLTPTPALPRSRFQERLSKSPNYQPRQNSSKSTLNPFDENEEDNGIKIGTTRKRGKKRAPLPPKSLSSQNINEDNLNVPPHSSQWSLTSADTEISYSTDNISETDYNTEELDRLSIAEKFVDFNKEMEKLNDDSNNNIITIEDKEVMVVPDLVSSCPNGDIKSPVSKLHESIEEHEKDLNYTNGSDDIKESNDTCDVKSIHENESVEIEENGNAVQIVIAEENVNFEETVNKNENSTEKTKQAPIAAQEDEIPHIDEDDTESNDSSVLIVNDITCNLQDDSFLYHEKKSLYIAGSIDELNSNETYTDQVSLYVIGSKEELDSCNNNEVCDNVKSEQTEDSITPIPKQRKNKLSKSSLLGTS